MSPQTAVTPDQIEWTEPRNRRGGKSSLVAPETLAALRDRPGEWACIKRGHPASSALANYKRKGFLAQSRKGESGGFDLYLCWPK